MSASPRESTHSHAPVFSLPMMSQMSFSLLCFATSSSVNCLGACIQRAREVDKLRHHGRSIPTHHHARAPTCAALPNSHNGSRFRSKRRAVAPAYAFSVPKSSKHVQGRTYHDGLCAARWVCLWSVCACGDRFRQSDDEEASSEHIIIHHHRRPTRSSQRPKQRGWIKSWSKHTHSIELRRSAIPHPSARALRCGAARPGAGKDRGMWNSGCDHALLPILRRDLNRSSTHHPAE